MPVKFSTLFVVSAIITLLVSFGPLAGTGVAGGLICVWVFCNLFLVRLIIAGIVLCTIGIPSLILAAILYALVYVGYAVTHQVQHVEETTPSLKDVIIDAEFTEVN